MNKSHFCYRIFALGSNTKIKSWFCDCCHFKTFWCIWILSKEKVTLVSVI